MNGAFERNSDPGIASEGRPAIGLVLTQLSQLPLVEVENKKGLKATRQKRWVTWGHKCQVGSFGSVSGYIDTGLGRSLFTTELHVSPYRLNDNEISPGPMRGVDREPTIKDESSSQQN